MALCTCIESRRVTPHVTAEHPEHVTDQILAAWIASDEAADRADWHQRVMHDGSDMAEWCDTCVTLEAAYDDAFRAASRLDREVGS